MGFTDFILFVVVCSALSLSIVFSLLWAIIWHAFGTYILILLAGIIIVKVALKLRKSKQAETPNA